MRVDVGVAHHGVLDAELNTRLARVDADLDRIVDAPRMRQGWGWSRVYARTS